ncbi:MAG TPA: T9SS type A sorting domain-containing protein [Chryseolinea sp.]|nr:T9SS type A sorting domain-containing protein [Chryseolinea sp.]
MSLTFTNSNRRYVFYLFTLILLIVSSLAAKSQTTLTQGDISIVGISANAPKGLSFVTWVTLSVNTEIRFTDNGFYSNNPSKNAGNVRWQESVLIWKATTQVNPGTVIKIEGETTNSGTASVMNADGNTTPTALAINNNSADQVFAYQGPNMPATTTAAFVFNATFNNTILFGIGIPTASGATGSTGWSTGTVTASGTSYLPSDLLPVNTMYLNNSATGGRYTGPRTGFATALDYRTEIAKIGNWTMNLGTTTGVTYVVTAFQIGSTLPLHLLSFSGRTIPTGVLLEWRTDNEMNTSVFEIQRSTDGAHYVVAGNVAAMSTPGLHAYTFTDAVLTSQTSYYRLKQTDMDGRFTYSPVIKFSGDRFKDAVSLYPNPVINQSSLTIQLTHAAKTGFSLMDNNGKLIREWNQSLPSGTTVMAIDLQGQPAGVYLLGIKNEKFSQQIRLVKQ